jgi:hypothetical protein
VQHTNVQRKELVFKTNDSLVVWSHLRRVCGVSCVTAFTTSHPWYFLQEFYGRAWQLEGRTVAFWDVICSLVERYQCNAKAICSLQNIGNPLPSCKTWSPEEPCLQGYKLLVESPKLDRSKGRGKKEVVPGPPGWGLCMRLTTLPQNTMCIKKPINGCWMDNARICLWKGYETMSYILLLGMWSVHTGQEHWVGQDWDGWRMYRMIYESWTRRDKGKRQIIEKNG